MSVPAPEGSLLDRLAGVVSGLQSVVVGYSGGIDSTLLLKVACLVLGRERVVGVTAVSPSLPAGELSLAEDLARAMGAEHVLVESREMEDPRYLRNDSDRCYFCKGELFRILEQVRAKRGFRHIAYGANRDDLDEFRPGMRAAGEAGARAPLLEAELGKAEIRRLGRHLVLPNWDKPARACLSSRIPRGVPIRAMDLDHVERAEDLLMALGFRQVRVRHHGEVARIETDAEGILRFSDPAVRRRVASALKALGFRFVSLDLEGYRPGSLAEPPPPTTGPE